MNFAPVALALTLGYALVTGLFARGASFGDNARGMAIVVAGVALGMAMRRDPDRFRRTLGRGLQHLSWQRIALGALSVRVLWVLVSDVTQTSDFAAYDRMARDISSGRYYVDPGRPMGPSVVFALHYLVLGYQPLAPQLTLALLSTAQVLLVYSLLLKTTSNTLAALLGSMILAVWPEHVLYVNLLGSDVLFSTLALLATWLLTLSFRRPLAAVFAVGMVLGVSHWVRNTAFAFLLPGSFFLALRDGWPLRRRAVALGAGFLIPVLPLSYVNYLSIGVPSPMASQLGGWSLFVGANSASRGMWTKQDEALIDQRVAARTPLPGEHRHVFRERISREMALERIREQPGAYVRTILRYKVSLLWARAAEISWAVRQSRFGTCEQWMKQGVDFFHGLAMASAVVGLCWVAARRRYAWDVRQVLFWAALLTTAVHGLMEVQPRYHHMFLPTLAIAIGQIMTADDACRPPHPSRR